MVDKHSGGWLTQAMEKAEVSVEKVADVCGVSVQAVYKWKKTGQFARKHLSALSRLLGVSEGYLVDGRDDTVAGADRSELVYIPLLNITGEGGFGFDTETGDEIEWIKELAFEREWIEEKGWSLERLHLTKVAGYSMAPYLNPGDVAMIHERDIKVSDSDDPRENVFAVMEGPRLRYKHISYNFDGSLTLSSFNPDKNQFRDQRVSGDEIQALKVVGRVVWRGG